MFASKAFDDLPLRAKLKNKTKGSFKKVLCVLSPSSKHDASRQTCSPLRKLSAVPSMISSMMRRGRTVSPDEVTRVYSEPECLASTDTQSARLCTPGASDASSGVHVPSNAQDSAVPASPTPDANAVSAVSSTDPTEDDCDDLITPHDVQICAVSSYENVQVPPSMAVEAIPRSMPATTEARTKDVIAQDNDQDGAVTLGADAEAEVASYVTTFTLLPRFRRANGLL